jgi:MFS family permease
MAFTLAYGLFEIPTGRLGDQLGSRQVLTRIVLWWSAFTVITGMVGNFTYIGEFGSVPLIFNSLTLMVLVRFWFGAGEAGALPNAARILLRWFHASERGRMQGAFQASMHIGGTIAPKMAAVIIAGAGWRATFFIFGLAGVVWAGLFYWWFRDNPAEHPSVNAAELDKIGPPPHGDVQQHDTVPWREVARHPNVWLLGISVTMSAFSTYLFFSWYPTYLQEARLVSNQDTGWLAALALLGATAGSLIGGAISDRITRHAADRYRARRWLCLTTYLAGAFFLTASVHVDRPVFSAILCALACLAISCQLPTWWAVAFDVSGKHTGSLFGLLNGMGVFGALGSQFFFGAFSDWRKAQGFLGRDQWDPAFYVCAGLLVIAGILWQFMYPRLAIGETTHSD